MLVAVEGVSPSVRELVRNDVVSELVRNVVVVNCWLFALGIMVRTDESKRSMTRFRVSLEWCNSDDNQGYWPSFLKLCNFFVAACRMHRIFRLSLRDEKESIRDAILQDRGRVSSSPVFCKRGPFSDA